MFPVVMLKAGLLEDCTDGGRETAVAGKWKKRNEHGQGKKETRGKKIIKRQKRRGRNERVEEKGREEKAMKRGIEVGEREGKRRQ